MANALFRKHLIHICDVRRNSSEPPPQSASGESIPDWSTEPAALTNQRCRFVAKTERIANESAGFLMHTGFLMLFDEGVDVRDSDVINNVRCYADNSAVDTGPFRIESVLKRRSTGPHHVSAQLERVE